MPSQQIKQFVIELLKKAALIDEKDGIDMDYVDKLAIEVEKRMGLLVMQELNEDAMLAYAKLVDEGKAEDAQASYIFFKTNIPDFDGKRQKWLEDFAYDFLNRTQTAQHAMEA